MKKCGRDCAAADQGALGSFVGGKGINRTFPRLVRRSRYIKFRVRKVSDCVNFICDANLVGTSS
jgi:hypothetical protein